MFQETDNHDSLQLRLLVRSQHEGHATSLTSKFQPLLAGLDPELTYIRVMTPLRMAKELPGTKMDAIETLARMNCSFNRDRDLRLGGVDDDSDDTSNCSRSRSATGGGVVRTPALAVMLFLRETGAVSAAGALKQLQQPPWSFHHKIELSNLRKGNLKVIGRQEFYACDVRDGGGGGARRRPQPLWAVCPVHCGTEHLRFTIFTQHFSKMVNFYQLLVGHEAEFTRTNFCLFTVTHNRGSGRDVQLAIKKSERLEPVPLSTAFLTFQVPNVHELEGLVHAPNGSAGTLGRVGNNLWLMRDPDSNCLLVEEGPKPWRSASVSPTSPSRSVSSTDSTKLPWPNSTSPFASPAHSMSSLKPNTCVYRNNSQIGCLKRWATSTPQNNHLNHSLLENAHKQPNLFHLPNLQWTDLSSWDSGWQSGRSDPETAESVSAYDDTETETGSCSSGVFLCDCDVTAGQGCELCCEVRSVSIPTLAQRNGQIPCPPKKPSQFKPERPKRKPWEVDTMDLSMREWDDILSLSNSNEFCDVQGRSKIDAALNNLNLNQYAFP